MPRKQRIHDRSYLANDNFNDSEHQDNGSVCKTFHEENVLTTANPAPEPPRFELQAKISNGSTYYVRVWDKWIVLGGIVAALMAWYVWLNPRPPASSSTTLSSTEVSPLPLAAQKKVENKQP